MSLLQQLQSLLQVEGYTHNIYTLCTVENRWTHTDVQQKEFHSFTAVNNMNLSVRVQSGHRLGFNVRFSPSSYVIRRLFHLGTTSGSTAALSCLDVGNASKHDPPTRPKSTKGKEMFIKAEKQNTILRVQPYFSLCETPPAQLLLSSRVYSGKETTNWVVSWTLTNSSSIEQRHHQVSIMQQKHNT